MQFKGLVRFFAILLIIYSIYQLSFTLFVKQHENKMEERALRFVQSKNPEAKKYSDPEELPENLKKAYDERLKRLLDSTRDQTVTYGITGAVSYQKAKEEELNLGLDLQGGMNVTMEVEMTGLMKDRTIIVNGLSKGFAMTGWRLGYIAANIEVAKACEKIQGQFTSGANSITQKAAVTALTTDLRPTMDMVKEFTRRKKRVLELVREIPGLTCTNPEGAFYVFPDVSYYYGKSDGNMTIRNSGDFCMFLLNTAHVSSVMGEAFGEPDCVRFSFANSMEKIEEGWKRISKALNTLK